MLLCDPSWFYRLERWAGAVPPSICAHNCWRWFFQGGQQKTQLGKEPCREFVIGSMCISLRP